MRPDPFSTYRAGFEVRTYRRAQRLLFFNNFPTEPERRRLLASSARSTLRYSDQQSPADPRSPIYTLLVSADPDRLPTDAQGRLHQPVPAAARIRLQRSRQIRPTVLSSTRQPRQSARGRRRLPVPLGRPRRRGTVGHPHRPRRRLVLQAQPQRPKSAQVTARPTGSLEHSARSARRHVAQPSRCSGLAAATARSRRRRRSSTCRSCAPAPAGLQRAPRRRLGTLQAVRVAAQHRLGRPQPQIRRPHRRRAGRHAGHRRRAVHVLPLARRRRLRRRPVGAHALG